ncbi:ATP-dependent RecD-like DNA helicase [Halalkalibacter sp. APA_J-10(15)]|uniref:ATP-dependent DNA helicase n=1 Tax=Halalkalibacter sp. APA_J-10(15) TaxID=2933805 RepID=UPI001FF59FB9|nr:ATP-binding domain-containing protein [Halalkalibacter sp. APA_J-10(15)]MCK0473972.1 ATP-dependent RecD-like DNA helicase [Halalkalibacter sp. APA_J-10(15)]
MRYLTLTLFLSEIVYSTKTFNSTGFTNDKYTFYVGDRVIQLKNNREKNLLNGDLGIVVGVSPAVKTMKIDKDTGIEELIEVPEKLIISFNENEVVYFREEIDELALAYCFSIHKAQGSEFPHVLLPISSAHKHMINRNLLYTAITRAKKEVIIIGELDVFLNGLKEKPRPRFTFLKELLQSESKPFVL